MDTHFIKTYNIYESEFKIYEGLILSHPLYKVVKILKNNFNITNINHNDNKFNLQFVFNSNYLNAKNELDNLLKVTNNLGWFPSYMSSFTNKNFKESVFSLNNFKEFIIYEFNNINFSFEAKYDILLDKYPTILYHVCDAKYVNKILKYGLIPKSRSKKSFHPERVYLAKTLENAYEIATIFNKEGSNKEWAIIEVDTSTIQEYLKLFKDPIYLDKGYFTLNNITPYCLKLNKILYF